ncbi:MAG: MBL fold metallo-hydrolase [Anaerolineaceae bacterium]|nr:MBL fold metallo-hydrolase [Anaerolineaceae bacterium]
MIGCRCPVCTSSDPHNRRTRASLLVRYDDRNILIDTTFDLRTQALAAGLDRLETVLFTHHHADHVCGFDDLRRFCDLQQARIPCYGNVHTIEHLQRMFPYVQTTGHPATYEIPVISFQAIDGPFDLFGRQVIPVPVKHGRWDCLGYRFGPLAYVTDVNAIPESSMELLGGLEVLILGALRHRPHPTHFTVAEALEVVNHLSPRRTYLTHICHDLDHATTNAALPDGVALAHDGLTFNVAHS